MPFLFSFLLLLSVNAFGADTTRLYNPQADVRKDMIDILARARKEKKHVLLQIGENGCVGCYRFNSFVRTDSVLKSLEDGNFIVYHLNYSSGNKNLDYMKKLGYPQRFGFPVLVVLDANGNRLHTQDCSLLEKGNGYDRERVKDFLIYWAPSAFYEPLYK